MHRENFSLCLGISFGFEWLLMFTLNVFGKVGGALSRRCGFLSIGVFLGVW